jgi:hypothetical protein|tara:strand:+ start:433 stop:627 length:195 start_codon:yes stop_codon:yes gene_type:complete
MITISKENGITSFISDNHGLSQEERHSQFVQAVSKGKLEEMIEEHGEQWVLDTVEQLILKGVPA